MAELLHGKKVLPDGRGDVTIKGGQIPADARDGAGKGPARLADTGIRISI